jgi:hypothetical protein
MIFQLPIYLTNAGRTYIFFCDAVMQILEADIGKSSSKREIIVEWMARRERR